MEVSTGGRRGVNRRPAIWVLSHREERPTSGFRALGSPTRAIRARGSNPAGATSGRRLPGAHRCGGAPVLSELRFYSLSRMSERSQRPLARDSHTFSIKIGGGRITSPRDPLKTTPPPFRVPHSKTLFDLIVV
jgi:hypothetical protein